MRYTITSDGIRESSSGEFTWIEAKAERDRRRAEAQAAKVAQMSPEQRELYESRREMQRLAEAGVHVAPRAAPTQRDTWNDEPPEDM